MDTSRLMNWIVGVLGWWEIEAPFVFGYTLSGTAFWNEIIVGFLFIILGVWAGSAQHNVLERVLDIVTLIIGVWLIISPFLLGYTGSEPQYAMWNPIVVGIVVVILEIIAFLTSRRPGTIREKEGA